MRWGRLRDYSTPVLPVCLLVALGAAGAAWAEKPIATETSYPPLAFDAGFAPKNLSKEAFRPIVLRLSGEVRSEVGVQPPPLEELVLDLDRDIAISTEGYPTCQLEARDTTTLEKICGTAIMGTGQASVSVAFAEQNPIPATSKLLLLNGGTSGGKTTLFVHAYLTQPITTAIVTTIKVTKIHNGRFGTKAVATIPPIANGAGSVTSFNLTVNRGLKVKGKPFSSLFAKCPDGHLNAHGIAMFKDGTKAEAEVTRPCTGKG
jgi:hypothetical protein